MSLILAGVTPLLSALILQLIFGNIYLTVGIFCLELVATSYRDVKNGKLSGNLGWSLGWTPAKSPLASINSVAIARILGLIFGLLVPFIRFGDLNTGIVLAAVLTIRNWTALPVWIVISSLINIGDAGPHPIFVIPAIALTLCHFDEIVKDNSSDLPQKSGSINPFVYLTAWIFSSLPGFNGHTATKLISNDDTCSSVVMSFVDSSIEGFAMQRVLNGNPTGRGVISILMLSAGHISGTPFYIAIAVGLFAGFLLLPHINFLPPSWTGDCVWIACLLATGSLPLIGACLIIKTLKPKVTVSTLIPLF